MNCEYGYNDCMYLDKKCHLCIESSQYKQIQIKKKTYGIQKKNTAKSKRMGSVFEETNNKNMQSMIKDIVTTAPTINSGASSKDKGDQKIRGIINVMEELKTQEVVRARGHKSFTIQKSWLDKLEEEGSNENMEFWYLKFAFKDTDTQSYTVIDSQQMMFMIETMISDRKIAKEADSRIDVANKRRILVEAENTKLLSEIDYLKALLKQNNILY